MSHPTSFRLPDALLEQLDEEAGATGTSVSSLVTTLLNEGINTRRFPGIIYRDGPTGRRAGLVAGPDVWEVVRAVKDSTGQGEKRLRAAAEASGLAVSQVRLAVDFYAAHPAEVDERIALDEREAVRVRRLITERERLLSS